VSGLILSLILREALRDAGLNIVVSPGTVGVSVLATLLMCALASATSLWAVFRLEAATVLR
jgi:hypothetical protein